MADRHLILVKHSAPLVEPDVAPDLWKLSPEGRRRCLPLALKILVYRPARIVSSEEAKAAETARLVADELKIPVATNARLGEHDRGNVPHLRSGEFISMIELLFRRPDQLVLGRETARAIEQRFDNAIADTLADEPAQSVAVVSHGTILAAWLAPRIGRRPFELWRQLGLPSLVALSLPELALVECVDRFDAPAPT